MKKSPKPPPIQPEPEWREVRLPFNIGSGRTIYSGLENDARLRLRVFQNTRDQSLIGRVWFGLGADGPPLHAHGGAVAYVLDEAMGSVAWMNGHPVVAAGLEFKYFQPTPLEVDLHVSARVISATDKWVEIESRLCLPDGKICVVGSGEFARLSRGKIKQFARFAVGSDLEAQLGNFETQLHLDWAPDDAG